MNGTIETDTGSTVQVWMDEKTGALWAQWREPKKDAWWSGDAETKCEQVRSVTAEKGKPIVIVTEKWRTVTLPVAARIVCTSKTIGTYEASGFWSGPS